MKVSNPVVINALLAKNAEVEGAVAENAAFKVGDIVTDKSYPSSGKFRIVQANPDGTYNIKPLRGGPVTMESAEYLVAANADDTACNAVTDKHGKAVSVGSRVRSDNDGGVVIIEKIDGNKVWSRDEETGIHLMTHQWNPSVWTVVNASRAVARNASTSADQLHTLASQALIAAKKAREYADECIRNLDSLDGEEYKTKKQEYARAFKPLLELSKINFGKVSVM